MQENNPLTPREQAATSNGEYNARLEGGSQQQPPDWLLETPWPGETLTLALVLLVAMLLPMRSLIWRAMVRKACSTLLAFLAEVSRKGMPRLSANSWEKPSQHISARL